MSSDDCGKTNKQTKKLVLILCLPEARKPSLLSCIKYNSCYFKNLVQSFLEGDMKIN